MKRSLLINSLEMSSKNFNELQNLIIVSMLQMMF